MLRRAAAILLLALVFPFAPLSRSAGEGLEVRAEQDPIRVLTQTHENRFPASLRFAVKAEADAPITKAAVYWKLGDQTTTSYARVALSPGRQVAAEYQLDLRRFYIPPGVQVRYQWRLEDEAGHRLAAPWRTFVLDDPRFQWRTAKGQGVEVSWYGGGDDFGKAVLDVGVQALARLAAEDGVKTDQTVKVLIYASEADFQGAASPSAQEWAGGLAYVRYGLAMIAIPPGSVDYARRVVPHELSHLVVYQATRNPYGGLPTWLDEGLAMVAEGELDSGFARSLATATREDRLISVWTLSSAFPTDSQQAELSYAESYGLVKYVEARYGAAGMSRLLAQFRDGSTYDDALLAALGVDTWGLDDAWRASLGRPPVPTPAAAGTQSATELNTPREE